MREGERFEYSKRGREGVNEGEREGQSVKVCDDGSTLILLLSLTG